MDTSLSINPAITDELVQTIETILRKWEPKFFNKSNEERDFIRNYLGPAMERNNLLHKKIIIWDYFRKTRK